MTRTTLYFTAPYAAEVRHEPVPDPAPREVRVRTTYSAVSPGTELLIYRGQHPDPGDDAALDPLTGSADYPLACGYSTVGVVEAVGREVDADWQGRRVFGFQPHTSHFCCAPARLIPLPAALDDRDAVFIPNMETAVNLVMDGAPRIGERVLVLGQGVVGLLTTALLNRFPLEVLAATDRYAARRARSLELGADHAFDPSAPSTDQTLREVLRLAAEDAVPHGSGADLLFELTGVPAALDDAIRYAGFESRIVVGSWYGARRAAIDLGGRFHRRRIRIVSSQVSTVASTLRGRWDKERRMQAVLSCIQSIKPSQLITNIIPIQRAPEAFETLSELPHDKIQMLFNYHIIHK